MLEGVLKIFKGIVEVPEREKVNIYNMQSTTFHHSARSFIQRV